ncbi:30S ribosomal protein S20 [Haematospirillum jordaniae]|uniref:Small ribosomal subunit protein bS20 n=1 Tax=Haematospirillum jordaniae TaxID=1549855 RepID=A0A143DDD7_9PROT|nr:MULTISPECIES: 30S ribosomal protein S20 [Haematospirillum]AMW34550.1 30S ribosomal protein S20 [Haematospirillum jordaniae]NKD44884.1 30S ribosomal protein S20 [Haematospirillum jordaniae]NKD55748.1 30S ribosomal protein S20 [Haematospirillum sp. H4890]NKD57909.1 30S ribosomal protein S20 [Haematospirillum jordaniae]NKD59979.1 30S ribosomal protein S20 [Haematospirillum jordaniae]
MAHHKSAQKRIRRNARRFAINHARKSRVRTFIKKVELAVAGGDKAAADAAFKVAQPEMMRGAQKGVFHKNTMSRKVSRLSAQIKALPAAA